MEVVKAFPGKKAKGEMGRLLKGAIIRANTTLEIDFKCVIIKLADLFDV